MTAIAVVPHGKRVKPTTGSGSSTAKGEVKLPDVLSVASDGTLKLFSGVTRKQARGMKVSDMPLSCCAVTANGQLLAVGGWANSIAVYSVSGGVASTTAALCLVLTFLRRCASTCCQVSHGYVTTELRAHEDAVSSVTVDRKGQLLASGSWDATVKVYELEADGTIPQLPLHNFFDHETHVTCVALSPDGTTLVSGAADGMYECGGRTVDTRSSLRPRHNRYNQHYRPGIGGAASDC